MNGALVCLRFGCSARREHTKDCLSFALGCTRERNRDRLDIAHALYGGGFHRNTLLLSQMYRPVA